MSWHHDEREGWCFVSFDPAKGKVCYLCEETIYQPEDLQFTPSAWVKINRNFFMSHERCAMICGEA